MGITRDLCEWVVATKLDDLPAPVLERTKEILLDGIGCGIFGARLDWSDKAVQGLTRVEGSGEGIIWGWNQATTPSLATLLNGTFIQGSELDDIHSYGPLHSAACVVPGVLACSTYRPELSGSDALLAIALGFEVGPRVGMALGGLDLVDRGWHCGSIFGTIASAVGVGKALGLSVDQLEDAVGIAATQACGLMGAQFEAMVKRMHSGFAARSGLTGGLLAQSGFTGIKGVIEKDYGGFASTFSPAGSDLSLVTRGLGSEWEVQRIVVKPAYSCMGQLHSAIDALRDIRQSDEAVAAGEVESVRIGLPAAAQKHAGWQLERPATVIGAQMNIAYAVAVTLLDGEPSVPQFSPERINDDDVWGLIPRVTTYPDDELEAMGDDARFGCRLHLTTRDGREIVREVLQPFGHSSRPITGPAVTAKFQQLMSYVTTDDHANRLAAAVQQLEQEPDLAPLLGELGREVRAPYETAST